jgi:hypothetical protein
MSLTLTTTHENTAIFRGVSGGFLRQAREGISAIAKDGNGSPPFTRLTFGHISLQLWHGSGVQYQQRPCHVLPERHRTVRQRHAA